jgi:hypothetical protein
VRIMLGSVQFVCVCVCVCVCLHIVIFDADTVVLYKAVHGFWPVEFSSGRQGASN